MGTVFEDSDIEGGSQEECFVEDWEVFEIPPDSSSNKQQNPANTQKPYNILSVDDIVATMVAIVSEAQELIPFIPTTTIRILLCHYKWNRTQLLQEYFEAENMDKFFTDIKIINPFDMPLRVGASNSNKWTECDICCGEITESMKCSLDCGHSYCKTCWNQYLTVNIVDEGLSQQLICMNPTCKIAITDEFIMDILDDTSVILKYKYFMTKNFVQIDKMIQWCASPDCKFAVQKLTKMALLSYLCNCGETYCFECGDPEHAVVTCEQLKQFKTHVDCETYQWIINNAKNCPQCSAPIEKNGGCNHMTCRGCQYNFCWLCMGPWNNHNACNRYVEVENAAETRLARFKHYRDRFENQLESLKMERELCEGIKAQAKELQKTADMTANQTKFLRDAVDTLRRSRRTLAFTYVFAYYLIRNNQVEIFEDNQADLEAAVERLSGYLEHEVDENNVVANRANIIDRFIYCSKRCDVLLGHIEEGKEAKWFTFN